MQLYYYIYNYIVYDIQLHRKNVIKFIIKFLYVQK